MESINKTLYIEQFPLDTSEDKLQEIFSLFGTISSIDIPHFPPEHPLCQGYQKPKSKGYAFLEFLQKSDAERAFKFFNGLENILSLSQSIESVVEDDTKDDLRNKILHKTEYRSLMPLRVMMKQKYLELEQRYEEQRLKSLIKSAKLSEYAPYLWVDLFV